MFFFKVLFDRVSPYSFLLLTILPKILNKRRNLLFEKWIRGLIIGFGCFTSVRRAQSVAASVDVLC